MSSINSNVHYPYYPLDAGHFLGESLWFFSTFLPLAWNGAKGSRAAKWSPEPDPWLWKTGSNMFKMWLSKFKQGQHWVNTFFLCSPLLSKFSKVAPRIWDLDLLPAFRSELQPLRPLRPLRLSSGHIFARPCVKIRTGWQGALCDAEVLRIATCNGYGVL